MSTSSFTVPCIIYIIYIIYIIRLHSVSVCVWGGGWEWGKVHACVQSWMRVISCVCVCLCVCVCVCVCCV